MHSIISESISDTLQARRLSKTDWGTSPFLKVRNAGKNAVGDFGEYCVRNYYNSIGVKSQIVKKGHDVIAGSKKIEVKTAFKNKGGSFFFNQIYYEHQETSTVKDWDHLAFVFVSPERIEIWECERPNEPELYFRKNNGWSWRKNNSCKLESIWKCIHSEDA